MQQTANEGGENEQFEINEQALRRHAQSQQFETLSDAVWLREYAHIRALSGDELLEFVERRAEVAGEEIGRRVKNGAETPGDGRE